MKKYRPWHFAPGQEVRYDAHGMSSRPGTDAFAIDPQLGEWLAADPGPILLVDDLIDSGWTLAVVARMLRRSGAAAVLPLVLALAG